MEPQKGIDYIGVAVVYFCHDGAGNFVMAKRSKNARDEQGRWDIGGGGLDHGLKVEDCVRKEIKEEYCADAKEIEFLGFREPFRDMDGQLSHWIALDFMVLVDPAEVKIGEPHKFDDLAWYTFETIPPADNMHSQLGQFFKQYADKINYQKQTVTK